MTAAETAAYNEKHSLPIQEVRKYMKSLLVAEDEPTFQLKQEYVGSVVEYLDSWDTTSSYGNCRGTSQELTTWAWKLIESHGNSVRYFVKANFCGRSYSYGLSGWFDNSYLYMSSDISERAEQIKKYRIDYSGQRLVWTEELLWTIKDGWVGRPPPYGDDFNNKSATWSHLTAN